jgi:hypothetical protein
LAAECATLLAVGSESPLEGRLESSAFEFTWQWSEASTVTASKFNDDSPVVIPITSATAPGTTPLLACGSPQSLSAAGSATVF